MSTQPLRLAGRLAEYFVNHPLTPVLALAGLVLGVVATLITPREEEPQIDVTMANVYVALPGTNASEVERLVAVPWQQRLIGIEGIEHVFANSRPGVAVLTAQFEVGVSRRDALVRLYNQVYSNADLLPPELGALPALVRPKAIDDVPVMTINLVSADEHYGALELSQLARTLTTELMAVAGAREVVLHGERERIVRVEPDPDRLARFGIGADDLVQALRSANIVVDGGQRLSANQAIPVQAGDFLVRAADVEALVVGARDGKPVVLADVARVEDGIERPDQRVWHFDRELGHAGLTPAPTVTLSLTKKPGVNAADLTRAVRERLAELNGILIPAQVDVRIGRDYGITAADKAMKLISKLAFATLAVVLLVALSLGWREAVVVGTAVVLTLALTLFASWAMGFTINRVSLFALIFAIGILVDDAIVVVENIHRRGMEAGSGWRALIPAAVDEIGAPTILATLTVIAALLPMAFVSGLMGPYMRPIPINASVGMVLSLLIALIVTPWLAARLLRVDGDHPPGAGALPLRRFFAAMLRPFFGPRAMTAHVALGLTLVALLGASVLLAGGQWVVLKMLPFDNKSELQLIVDLPEGSPVERTDALLLELAAETMKTPEVLDVQGYAGLSAPINFNGLVRQYDLRALPHQGDLQINLVDQHHRQRQSHEIAQTLRPQLVPIVERHGARLKLVEVPPGPPVMAPIVAEIYGPDRAAMNKLARQLVAIADGTDGLVDVDLSVEDGPARVQVVVDRARAQRLGVSPAQITAALNWAIAGQDLTVVRDGQALSPIAVRLQLSEADIADWDRVGAVRVRARDGALIPIGELLGVEARPWDGSLAMKDLREVVYVTADVAGTYDSPLYGMQALRMGMQRQGLGQTVGEAFIAQPANDQLAIKWDGEWQITFETFRDMGLAYAAGLLLIYLLIVIEFRRYLMPLVIMAPIPLTVIGVMPGHALLGAQFTATSMIGMIALAGIIVRNSILLVDFIEQARAAGQPLNDAVIDACAVRAKPIALTAIAAMSGAVFILSDPIFNGLAISLVFGILVSTVLTLLVIPLLYAALYGQRGTVHGPSPVGT